LLLYSSRVHPNLHSFPTRRSSDLFEQTGRTRGAAHGYSIGLPPCSPFRRELLNTSSAPPNSFDEASLGPAHNRWPGRGFSLVARSEEHTSELQSLRHLVCRLLLEK